jgi:uncharacterized membrane protein
MDDVEKFVLAFMGIGAVLGAGFAILFDDPLTIVSLGASIIAGIFASVMAIFLFALMFGAIRAARKRWDKSTTLEGDGKNGS